MSENAEPARGRATDTLESVIFGWWRGIQEARGDRAVLRRCGSVAEVAFTAPFHRLVKRLREADVAAPRTEWLAAIAGLLAQVEKSSSAKSLAAALGTPKGSKATLSGLRFRRLLRFDEPDELLVETTRVIRLLDRTVPVGALIRDVYWWGDRVRKRWAFDYYEAAPTNEP